MEALILKLRYLDGDMVENYAACDPGYMLSPMDRADKVL